MKRVEKLVSVRSSLCLFISVNFHPPSRSNTRMCVAATIGNCLVGAPAVVCLVDWLVAVD